MPLNILDASFRSFAHQVVPKLVDQGIAVLGMKPLASGAIPQNNIASAIEFLHYALSLPTSVVINGCDNMERLDQGENIGQRELRSDAPAGVPVHR